MHLTTVCGPDRLDDLVDVRVLEHVARGARLQRAVHAVRLPEAGDHDDVDGRVGLLDQRRRRDPVGLGHDQVHQHHVRQRVAGRERVEPVQCRAAVGGLADQLDPRGGAEERPQAQPHDLVVVDHEDPDRFARHPAAPRTRGATSRTTVPATPAWGDDELATQALRPLAHRHQPEPRSAGHGIEPDTVVGDLDQQRPRVVVGRTDPHLDVRGPGVFHAVVQRLLREPVGVELGVGRDVQARVGPVHGHRRPAAAGDPRRLLPHRTDEPVRVEQGRVQLEDERPHVVQCRMGQLVEGVQRGRPARSGSAPQVTAAARMCRVMENSRWQAESCSSRASRCRSSDAASPRTSASSRAFSTATAAWSAIAVRNAISSSSGS